MHTTQIRQRPVPENAYQSLIRAGIPPLLARLCAGRGTVHAEELQDDMSGLLPPALLTNCTAAAERLATAIVKRERILIIADYDADGATACAVGVRGLSMMGAVVDFLVPNRFEHGYGLTPELAELAAQKHTNLLLTVDNGIASVAGVKRAQALGMDVVITDHHLPGSEVPPCIIVNPNQRGCAFPSKNLAGVGVMFYVLIALRAHLRQTGYFSDSIPEPNLAALLDLVALGTVADVVTLDRNNRILVAQGLKRIRSGKMQPGTAALLAVAGRDWRKAQTFELGFAVGPRINAAGRLDDMSVGIACLLADDADTAAALANQLNHLNVERREIEHTMLQEALADFPDELPEHQATLVAFRTDFHQGVVGIVAGRLKERFYRPTIVFAPSDNGEIRGSGRSIPELHLRDTLDRVSKQHPDLIIKFGGHAMAAGLTIHEHRLAEFQQAFETAAQEMLGGQALHQTYLTDGCLNAQDMTFANATMLNAQVWGQGFAPPTFSDTFAISRQYAIGRNHKKLLVEKEGRNFEAIIWNCTDTLPERISAVYKLTADDYQGRQSVQLYVEHWEAA